MRWKTDIAKRIAWHLIKGFERAIECAMSALEAIDEEANRLDP